MCGQEPIDHAGSRRPSHPVPGLRQQFHLTASDVVHHADDTNVLIINELPDSMTFFEQLPDCPNNMPAGHGIDNLLLRFRVNRSQATAVVLRDNPTNLLEDFTDMPAARSDWMIRMA